MGNHITNINIVKSQLLDFQLRNPRASKNRFHLDFDSKLDYHYETNNNVLFKMIYSKISVKKLF